MDVNYLSSNGMVSSFSGITETFIGDGQDNNYIKFSNGVMIAYGSYDINTAMTDLNWKSPYTVTIKYPVSFFFTPRIFISNNTLQFNFAHDGAFYMSNELGMKTNRSNEKKFTIEYVAPLSYSILIKDGKDTSINYVNATFSWMAIGTWK